MDKVILVIGGTGLIGEHIARRLKEDGYRVRVMARDSNKARKMFDESFEIAIGDVKDTNSLEKSLNGCLGVHMNVTEDVEQLGAENVASVAPKKGVERITYTAGTNAVEENTWFPPVKGKLLAEKAIRESGIPYTIFCPTFFMESIQRLIRRNQAFIFGKKPILYHLVAAKDYARMVSVSYRLEEAANKKLFVHGPEAVTMYEALRRYCSVFRPEIRKISTMPFWLVRLIATVRRDKQMKFGGELISLSEKVGEGGDPTEANRILGAPQTTLEEWIRQRKAKLGMPSID
jgi:uncharacterized protein YbjT (DUF2867 family)